ncbi:hypothetical protein B0T19DRAFT_47007 [Cercophora scortea]|uniref:Uncharacterized protein n=1 Tax=Cercophora scortea TaxID=314031 RepID=A0AAE0J4Z9_9PEZI|nr:hypothetical protein B0T19DRAFT_47007 [Cercophora scortea]
MGTSSSKPAPRQQPRRGVSGFRSPAPTPQAPTPASLPSFFSFQQGSENAQNIRYHAEASPLLGRFRAVPRLSDRERARGGSGQPVGLLSAGYRGSVHVGYGALVAAAAAAAAAAEEEDGDGEEDEEEENEAYYREEGKRVQLMLCRVRRGVRRLRDVWVEPKAVAVSRVLDLWWSRWGVLVVLPALLAVAWCAVPFPQYPLPDDDDDGDGDGNSGGGAGGGSGGRRKVPGHGAALVQVNFWFFLLVYYSFYNLTALIWITKVFNLYSLNWWPQSLGFPITVSAIAVVSLAAPIPIYLIPETRWLTVHNTAWITWTFVIMALPVAIAFCILTNSERHLGLRHSLSETQRIFTSSWWAGEPDSTISRRDQQRRRPPLQSGGGSFDAAVAASNMVVGYSDDGFGHGGDGGDGNNIDGLYRSSRPRRRHTSMPVRLRRRWLPASFVRFIWFCLALSIGLLVYVIGEAYAEIYLRTLPHNNLETIVYVYGWISTVYLLDGLTGWILGGNEGERVGSYPLSWIFKLKKLTNFASRSYFMLTYQTYVRALYTRLRSSQFILLQVLSSTSLIIVTPILMSARTHWVLSLLGLNGQSYGAYQKMCMRNVFIRFVAENASMLAFLGAVVVLHFGPNKDVYPYFAFDDNNDDEPTNGFFDFGLTFYASSITWACELAASFIVAGLIRFIYGVSVVTEGKLDFAVWPELLPTSVVVVLHVLQNMLFTIVRLQFH